MFMNGLCATGVGNAALAKDLTTGSEAIRRGTLSELLSLYNSVKAYGDYTLVITGSGACYIGKTILKFERRSYRRKKATFEKPWGKWGQRTWRLRKQRA